MGGDKDGEIMKETINYGFKKPEKNEYININVLNDNMDKVDQALNNLKNTNIAAINRQNHVILVTFAASAWTGSAPPYTQTVAVDGVVAEDEPFLVSALDKDADLATQGAYNKAFGIIAAGIGDTGNGSVIYKVFKKPEIDVMVGLRGVGLHG